MLEKTLESPLDCKEIKPVHPKGNQSWILIGRTDAEAEAPVIWPPDAKSCLIGKDPDAGKDWRQEEKGTTEDEMVGWHHRLSGHELGQTPGDGEGQEGLECCSPWGLKKEDMTRQLNNNSLKHRRYNYIGKTHASSSVQCLLLLLLLLIQMLKELTRLRDYPFNPLRSESLQVLEPVSSLL